MYLGKIYTPIFCDAAPSVPSFIGLKVIFWWKFILDGFLSNFVQMCIIVKSTQL